MLANHLSREFRRLFGEVRQFTQPADNLHRARKRPLALSPKFQFTTTARYEWAMDNGYMPFVQGTFHHVGSSISSDVTNTDIRWTGGNVTYNS